MEFYCCDLHSILRIEFVHLNPSGERVICLLQLFRDLYLFRIATIVLHINMSLRCLLMFLLIVAKGQLAVYMDYFQFENKSCIDMGNKCCLEFGPHAYNISQYLAECIMDVSTQCLLDRNNEVVTFSELNDFASVYNFAIQENYGFVLDSASINVYTEHLETLQVYQQKAVDQLKYPRLNFGDPRCPNRSFHPKQELYWSVNELPKSPHRGAIVILAQGTTHSTYGHNLTLVKLRRSLELLYEHYNNKYGDDIWIFHTGDISRTLQNDIRQHRSEIRFYTLSGKYWEVYPSFVAGEDQIYKFPAFSVGYRKMIRFYSIHIWQILATMGYTYVWRMDDDSYITSAITYNIFDFMAYHQYDYAYHNIENSAPSEFHWDVIRTFVRNHNITNYEHIMDTCTIKGDIKHYNYINCGIIPSYYNNFFVTNVTRWLLPDVQAFLTMFDESGVIFTLRWGDSFIQSSAIRLLFDESRIHRFVSWGYAHGIVIQAGLLDLNPMETLTKFSYELDENHGRPIGLGYSLTYFASYRLCNETSKYQRCMC